MTRRLKTCRHPVPSPPWVGHLPAIITTVISLIDTSQRNCFLVQCIGMTNLFHSQTPQLHIFFFSFSIVVGWFLHLVFVILIACNISISSMSKPWKMNQQSQQNRMKQYAYWPLEVLLLIPNLPWKFNMIRNWLWLSILSETTLKVLASRYTSDIQYISSSSEVYIQEGKMQR